MAELVQLRIENTLPEMEQMERIGIFTRNEIKKIVKQRKALEYVLRRRKTKKQDFLKYIQYEINLLSLITVRRKKFQCDFKKQEIDHVIASRINKLFKTVILRYQDDVKLWISQIEFCKRMKWYGSISGLFTRMLQVHSSNPSLWIMAAKWEMEEVNAPENARQLLQRALRYHPKSKQLWLEYFRMELMYSDMVRKRKDVLGIQNIKTVDMENDAILKGDIASVIFKNATSAIEGVEFALSFLPICQEFDFTEKHIEDIFEEVQLKYPDSEETLDANARYKLLFLKQENEKIEKDKEKGYKKRKVLADIEESITASYEEAVKKVPTQKMWQFYIDFTLSKLKSGKMKEKRENKIQIEVLKLYDRASEVDCLTSDQRINWINLLRCRSMNEKSLEIALETARKCPENASVWHFCLSLYIADSKNFKEVALLFAEAVSCIKDKESMSVWHLGLKWLSLVNPSKLTGFFESGIEHGVSDDERHKKKNIISCLKVMYLEVSALQEGISAARKLYARLNSLPPVPVKLYEKMIAIELAQLKPSLEKIRKCYEEALRNFGTTDINLWLNYMRFEMEHGNPGIYNMLYWRAMKALDMEFLDDFIAKVTLFSTGHELSNPFTNSIDF